MKCYICDKTLAQEEINTAPGLEGTTVTDYAAFFRGMM